MTATTPSDREPGLTSSTEILLIRHGVTDWNAVRRLQGHTDIPLNAEGEQQAAALALALQDGALDAIFSSDLQRASQTAQAIAQRLSLTLRVDAGLRERCYGAFEGLNRADVAHHYPEFFAAWQAREVDVIFPQGQRVAESLRQFHARSITAIVSCAQQYAGKKIAIVTHGGVLECAYRAAKSLPLEAPRDFQILNASVNRFTYGYGELKLLAWGDVTHLEAMALDEMDGRTS